MRALWTGLVLLFAGPAVAGPAIMVRDALEAAEQPPTLRRRARSCS